MATFGWAASQPLLRIRSMALPYRAVSVPQSSTGSASTIVVASAPALGISTRRAVAASPAPACGSRQEPDWYNGALTFTSHEPEAALPKVGALNVGGAAATSAVCRSCSSRIASSPVAASSRCPRAIAKHRVTLAMAMGPAQVSALEQMRPPRQCPTAIAAEAPLMKLCSIYTGNRSTSLHACDFPGYETAASGRNTRVR